MVSEGEGGAAHMGAALTVILFHAQYLAKRSRFRQGWCLRQRPEWVGISSCDGACGDGPGGKL